MRPLSDYLGKSLVPLARTLALQMSGQRTFGQLDPLHCTPDSFSQLPVCATSPVGIAQRFNIVAGQLLKVQQFADCTTRPFLSGPCFSDGLRDRNQLTPPGRGISLTTSLSESTASFRRK
jgi:hypothetical protein